MESLLNLLSWAEEDIPGFLPLSWLLQSICVGTSSVEPFLFIPFNALKWSQFSIYWVLWLCKLCHHAYRLSYHCFLPFHPFGGSLTIIITANKRVTPITYIQTAWSLPSSFLSALSDVKLLMIQIILHDDWQFWLKKRIYKLKLNRALVLGAKLLKRWQILTACDQ